MPVRAVGINACLERFDRCINNEKACNRLKLAASVVAIAATPFIPISSVAGSFCGASSHYLLHKLCVCNEVYRSFDLPPRKWKHLASGVAVTAGLGAVAAISIPSSLGCGLVIGAGGIMLGHMITYRDFYCRGIVPQVFDDDQVRLEGDVPRIIPEGASAR